MVIFQEGTFKRLAIFQVACYNNNKPLVLKKVLFKSCFEDRSMKSPKIKTFVIIFVLFLFVGIITTGCKKASGNNWVNTDSMPGRTFSDHASTPSDNKSNNSTILYMGSDKDSPNVNFGPKDVSFDFRDLRQ